MTELKDHIEKYLRGELTPAEMHALEKKALNDPFLADALEGAGRLDNADDFKTDLLELQSALNKRIGQEQQKVTPIWVWTARIAAGLLLVILSTFVVYNLIEKNENHTELAQNKIADPLEQPQDAVATDSVITGNVPDERLSFAKPEEKPASSPAQTKPQQEKDHDLSQAAITHPVAEPPEISHTEASETEKLPEIIVAEDAVAQDAVAAPPVISSQRQQEKIDVKKNMAERSVAKQESVAGVPDDRAGYSNSNSNNVKVVRGQVTSIEDGKGLPGVNVVIKGTNIGTITDAEGNYQITTENRNVDLVFSFIGLQSTEANASTENEVNVQMSQDVSQLSEVVVTGYGGERTEGDDYITVEMAAPAGGRKAFKQYLEKNLNYPEQAIKNNVEGKVTVQFTVEVSGDLSNFKVLKGIGSGCDEEVIRLIKQGPKWTPTKRAAEAARDKVKVRLRFSLPKK